MRSGSNFYFSTAQSNGNKFSFRPLSIRNSRVSSAWIGWLFYRWEPGITALICVELLVKLPNYLPFLGFHSVVSLLDFAEHLIQHLIGSRWRIRCFCAHLH